MAAASSFTWTGKKLTIAELITCFCTTPLPLVVKVTQVPSDYEKSCPKLSIGTVLFISGSGVEQRVALKTSDRNPKFISIPLEAKLKFEVVYTHDRGPPTFLENLLRGKVQSDLKVEISGNNGNRLSSTPDQEHGFPYGTFQVVGTYKETVLHAQTILSASGELNPLRRNISVNCPVSLDIATGIYGKSADEFQKLKNRLKQSQSTKTTNQADPSHKIVLLSKDFISLEDAHLSSHVHCLYVCTESRETKKKSQPPPVRVKNRPGNAKTEVAAQEVTEEEAAAPVTACRDSVTSDCLYETVGQVGAQAHCSSDPAGDFEEYSLVVGTQHDCRSTYENLPPLLDNEPLDTEPPLLDQEPYLNEEQVKKVLRGGKVMRDSTEEYPKHCSYVYGVEPSGKDKQTEEGETRNTPVERRSIDTEGPGKAEDLEEEDSDQGVYEKMNDFKPVRRTPVHQKRERTTPDRPLEKTISTGPTTKKRNAANKPIDYRSQQNFLRCHSNEKITDHQNEKESQQAYSSAITSTSTLSLQASIEEEGDGDDQKAASTSAATSSASKPKLLKDNKVMKGFAGIGKKVSSTFSSGFAAIKDTHGRNTPRPSISSETWTSLADIPKDIRGFSIEQISLCLRLLNLEKYVEPFSNRLVDGNSLRSFNQRELVQHFQMDELEAKQLVSFARDQWRPR